MKVINKDKMTPLQIKHAEGAIDILNALGSNRYFELDALAKTGKHYIVRIRDIGYDGTACTTPTGEIYLCCWYEDVLDKSPKIIVSSLMGQNLHEIFHQIASNFKDFVKCQEMLGEYYKKKYGYNEQIGARLGGALYNIIEDGRIERIGVNKYPGSMNCIMYNNAILWYKNTLTESNPYVDFLTACLTISKIGKKPSHWKEFHDGDEVDAEVNKIGAIIFDATKSNFSADVTLAVMKINQIIEPFIKDELAKNDELIKELEKYQAQASTAENDLGAQQELDRSLSGDGNGYSINNPNGPQTPSNAGSNSNGGNSANGSGNQGNSANGGGTGNQPGQGVANKGGAHSAEDAFSSASEEDVDLDGIEKELEQDKKLDKEIESAKEQRAREAKNSTDEKISDSELSKLGDAEDLDFGDAKINSYQNALISNPSYDVPENVISEGNMIYQSLKKLFTNNNDIFIRRQKRGLLDSHRFASMVSMHNAGQEEDRLFYKVEKAVTNNCAAYIIVDTSGSTSGEVFDRSMEACATIERGIGKLLPLKIAAYDSNYDFQFRVIRDFRNKNTDINLSHSFKCNESAGGGTPTAEAIALAGYELDKKRNESHKLLVVITDGQPDNSSKVKTQIKALRKKGIKVISILVTDSTNNGFDREFKNMCDNKDVITDSSNNLSKHMIEIMTKWVMGSFRQ